MLNGQVLETNEFSKSLVSPLASGGLPLSSILFHVYLVVMLGLAIRLIRQLLQVRKIIKKSSKYRADDLVYCDITKELAPCSFFNYIIVNKKLLSLDEYRHVLKHEEAHCRQWHSIDILLIECLHIALWINPLMFGLKKSLKLNLEHLADEAVLASGIHPKKYQYQLLANISKVTPLPVMNSLQSSKLKQRILMMNMGPSDKIHLIKHLLAVPFLLCLYITIQLVDGPHRYADNDALNKLYDKLTGYYQYIGAKHVLIHIMNQDGKLALEQSWDNRTISFEQQQDLNFYNAAEQFPLKFIESADGKIAKVLAFEEDVWNKIEDYKSVAKQEVMLPPESLEQLEGYYQYQGGDRQLKITAAPNKIVLHEFWTGNDITLFPESSTLFFSKRGNFPLEFIRNEHGTVIKAIAFDKDIWHKVKTNPLSTSAGDKDNH
ncbi:M56 family metallopeptidase [Olivibacter sp. SDN3]|nr:M56 family metallopeptidase [Olivibacter sp. SDN3]QNL48120.1 M56 family metallopeptidase [Olivibacter sp. SDN3]